MKFKSITSHLLFRIVLAMALGIVCAWFFTRLAWQNLRYFQRDLLSAARLYVIPLIILGFVKPAIAEVGTRAGRMLLVTALIAYGSTLVAGFSSLLDFGSPFSADDHWRLRLADRWRLRLPRALFYSGDAPADACDDRPRDSFHSRSQVASLPADSRFMPLLGEFRRIVSMVIEKVIIPLLPVYIFGIFLNMTYSGEVASILSTFAKIIGVIFLMHILWLILQFCAVAPMSPGSRNPIRLLGTMLPAAYFTALGTQSSAATIPVTLRQAEKLGVDPAVAGFTVPLCATIHMSGSTLKIVSCAVALMITRGMPFDFGMFAGFICISSASPSSPPREYPAAV